MLRRKRPISSSMHYLDQRDCSLRTNCIKMDQIIYMLTFISRIKENSSHVTLLTSISTTEVMNHAGVQRKLLSTVPKKLTISQALMYVRCLSTLKLRGIELGKGKHYKPNHIQPLAGGQGLATPVTSWLHATRGSNILRLLEGEDLTKIVKEFPQYVFGYKKLKGDIEAFKEDEKIDERDELPGELPNPWGKRMFVDTDIKKCHYWVYSSSPNKGKTTGFLEPIYQNYKAYWHDQTEPYWSISRETEIIIMDELQRGQIKAAKLNMICNGKAKYRIFEGGNISLNAKPLVIICSNFSIKEVFPYQYELVSSRFIEINVE